MGAPRAAGTARTQRTETPRRVLVVDDEAIVQRLLRILLERQGYLVDCAGNGREALEKIEGSPPDLIVLDLMMPVMDGWEVLSWLRQKKLRPAVIVVSAATDCNNALDKGATLVMRKPFSNASFLKACTEILTK